MYADVTVLLAELGLDQLEISTYIAVSMSIQYCHKNYLVENDSKTNQLVPVGKN